MISLNNQNEFKEYIVDRVVAMTGKHYDMTCEEMFLKMDRHSRTFLVYIWNEIDGNYLRMVCDLDYNMYLPNQSEWIELDGSELKITDSHENDKCTVWLVDTQALVSYNILNIVGSEMAYIANKVVAIIAGLEEIGRRRQN